MLIKSDDRSAERYHAQTAILPSASDVLPGAPPDLGVVIDLPSILPAPGPSLEQAILWRRTSRDFDPQAPLGLDRLARLLVFSCGRTAIAEQGLPVPCHRAVPSAGACYPVDVHVIALRVAGLASGAYAYSADRHCLTLRHPGQFDACVARWALDQPWMAHAAAVFSLVGALGRIKPRYASRGYRYMLFEAGHIAQNLYLLGAAYGLGAQATGGFADAAFARLLALPDGAIPLYHVCVGPQRGGGST
jgi:SagB-type dehydrogenase family enzyme